ncbi:hypothetical protein AB1N83_011564 [Pleurotus pulmonarius]
MLANIRHTTCPEPGLLGAGADESLEAFLDGEGCVFSRAERVSGVEEKGLLRGHSRRELRWPEAQVI